MPPSKVTGKAFDWSILRRIIGFAKPYQWQMIGTGVLAIVLGSLATLRPYLTREAVDSSIALDGMALNQWMTWLVISLLMEAIGQLIFTYSANDLGQRVIRDMRVRLFDKMLGFKQQFFDRTPVGKLVTRTVSDVETVSNIFSEGLLVIFGDVFKIVVMVSAMFFLFDPLLVLICLSVLPLLYVATRWFQRSIKQAFIDVRNEVAALNTFVQERITGMKIVQLFTRESQEHTNFHAINTRHKDANVRTIWYFSIFFPVIDMLSAVSIGLAIWYGGMQAAAGGDVTVGDLTAIIMFVSMLYRPLRQLADRFNTLQMGMVAGDRVLSLLDEENSAEVSGSTLIDELKGDIVLKDMHFSYNPGEPVLRGLNVHIKRGQTVAIVGATGSGKSTLVHLLMAFYRPTSGKILIDGLDLHTIELRSYRKQIALVQQDVFLFSDSVRNNVSMFKQIPDAKILEAAQAMGIDAFLHDLPEGLDYDVKERGGMLSTGQRQLLAFIRAYLTNPAVLILDEATSSIDSQAEQWIQKATKELTKGRTSIVVAHRLATILKADRILVMEKGQIIESGKHAELLAKQGLYANLYQKQFKDQ
ncbi:MAG: ABC transporter ATP-binding protein [Flavobacteriales bacterium]|jgi:ATP-binding cassette subfamily B multidrug efflux pump|tara:strand:+ start:2246 stop:4003 length:1758 start_codon:yes stop_codon:yes gene_type:complete